jgi:CRP-like cAMP-binding protein
MAINNVLLQTLKVDDLALILPELKAVELPLHTSLAEPGKPIEYVWFPEDSVGSIIATTAGGRQAEIALVGREGVIDLGSINGAHSSPFQCLIRAPGRAWRLPVTMLHRAMAERVDVRKTFSRYAQAFVVQVSHTALINLAYTLEQRLARWLLMTHDRIAGDEIVITHQFLSLMLGVRRAGVTTELQKLEIQGLIKAKRSLIGIVSRHGLEELAADAYGLPESEYRRLIGPDFRRRVRANGSGSHMLSA